MKKYLIVVFLVFSVVLSNFSFALANNHVEDQDTEQWEKELLSCTKEKSAVSVHISIDTSGSTKFTDPNGSRGTSTQAIVLNFQRLVQDLKDLENNSLEIEISLSTFQTQGKVKLVKDWVNLRSEPFNVNNFKDIERLLNESPDDAATSYLDAIKISNNQFNKKEIENSCEIFILMTDGYPTYSLADINEEFKISKKNNVFLIGVFLGNLEQGFNNLLGLLGEKPGLVKTEYGNTTDTIVTEEFYPRAKVYKAADSSELIRTFINIGTTLRAISTETKKNTLPLKTTNICSLNEQGIEECILNISFGLGTESATIEMLVSEPGNQEDIDLVIQPPPALNISEEELRIGYEGLKKNKFNSTNISVDWFGGNYGVIIITFDPDETTWRGSWRFSLVAQEKKGRTVQWIPTITSKLLPKIDKIESLRIDIETCIDIKYRNDTPPADATVKLLVKDFRNGEIITEIPAVETRRGHSVCITPDNTYPTKVILETDILYYPSTNEPSKADADSIEVSVLEKAEFPLITGPTNLDKQFFKGSEPVFFEFNVAGGNVDSVISLEVFKNSDDISPDVNWSIEYEGNKYLINTENNSAIPVVANSFTKLVLIGTPNTSDNLTTDTKFDVRYTSSVPSLGIIDVQENIEINTRFLDVAFATILQFAMGFFLTLLIIGLISSYLFSYTRSGLIADRTIRYNSYLLQLDKSGTIQWVNDNFYQDTYQNTKFLAVSNKKTALSNSLRIIFKQKMLPFLQDSSAEIKSDNTFYSSYNKSPNKSYLISPDINKLWILEANSYLNNVATGSLYVISNNEEAFDQLKDEFRNASTNLDFSFFEQSTLISTQEVSNVNVDGNEANQKSSSDIPPPPSSDIPPPPPPP